MVWLATKTIKLIEESIERDQGNSYREWLGKVIPHMDDAYRGNDLPFRKHLGASMIGNPCNRQLWYSFRWFRRPQFKGRLLRLFNRGHLEEARFIAMLLNAGIQVYQQDANGKQFRVSDCGGHFGGSGDGLVIGLPDLPDSRQPALSEFKTHNQKSFDKLVVKGLMESKPVHYIQMQIYMKKMGLPYGFYLAVCKNNDELYGEIVVLDDYVGQVHIAKANDIIFKTGAPERLHKSPSWFDCKYCDYSNICHGSANCDYNCRTCIYSLPIDGDGVWCCMKTGEELNEQAQYKACAEYKVWS